MSTPATEPEDRFKLLINGGIALSLLLIAGIFVTLGITLGKVTRNRLERLSAFPADSIQTLTDYDSQEKKDYYQISLAELRNDSRDMYRSIRSNTGVGDLDRKSFLTHLENGTDSCAQLIQEMRESFQDTLNQSGVAQDESTTSDYFERTRKEKALFTALFIYREKTEELAIAADLFEPVGLRRYFPLRDQVKQHEFIPNWDQSIFSGQPADVNEFLKELETDLLYYENHILQNMIY